MRKITIVFYILLIASAVSAQKITHVRSSLKNGVMKIKYDLKGDKQKKYHVQLFIAENLSSEYSKEILTADGDIGTDIKLGKDKEIHWDTKKDHLAEPEKIKFKLEARMMFAH